MHKIIRYLQVSYVEMTQRVSWPTLESLRASATTVLVASLIFSLIIGGVDSVFKHMMQFVYESF